MDLFSLSLKVENENDKILFGIHLGQSAMHFTSGIRLPPQARKQVS